MSSILMLSNGSKLDVDRTFADQGEQAVFGMVGGQRVLMKAGSPPKPTIYQKGNAFFTLDRKPITAEIAKPWLDDEGFPDALKNLFRKFLASVESGKPVKVRLGQIRPRTQRPQENRHLQPEEIGLPSSAPERV